MQISSASLKITIIILSCLCVDYSCMYLCIVSKTMSLSAGHYIIFRLLSKKTLYRHNECIFEIFFN